MSLSILIPALLMALVIGILLGLVGGGGSILTVPVLVYVLGVPAVEATAYSLFVVGATSSAGAAGYHRQGLIDWKTGITFAIPSMIAVFLVRSWILPMIPDPMGGMIGLSFSRDAFIMVVFSAVMAGASIAMIRDTTAVTSTPATKSRTVFISIFEGLGVGAVTGLVGAGGGFLIIPALVVLAGLPMRTAVGTSLMIIAVKSLIGFTGDLISAENINWSLLLPFTAFSLIGIFAGMRLSHRISSQSLKKGFGYFVAAMAIFILLTEIF